MKKIIESVSAKVTLSGLAYKTDNRLHEEAKKELARIISNEILSNGLLPTEFETKTNEYMDTKDITLNMYLISGELFSRFNFKGERLMKLISDCDIHELIYWLENNKQRRQNGL